MGSMSVIDCLTWMPLLLAESNKLADFMTGAWGIFQGLLGLGFVIFVHELGHFLAAKTFGVRCDKFYVGFDVPISIGPIKFPRTLGKFQWGETEYGIGIVPLGGYVKMLGQDDDPRNAEKEAERSKLGEGEDAPIDPRSYLAKPVWQRMIIISAGVVMNLIFAVIMAAIAYRVGVPYTPSLIGDTVAGGPAWQQGLQPGDLILKAGKMTSDEPHLRYTEFQTAVALYGKDTDGKPIPLAIDRAGQRTEMDLAPMKEPRSGFYLIGVLGPLTTKINSAGPFSPTSFLAGKSIDLKAGDKIVAVDGVPLAVDERFGEPLSDELKLRMHAKWNQPLTLTVQRPGKKKGDEPTSIDVEVPAVPMKSLGIDFQPGAITAVRKGSVAEQAGVKVGDVIVAVDGKPAEQALRLPTLVASQAGKTIEIKVRRPGSEPDATSELAFQMTAPENAQFGTSTPLQSVCVLAGLGIAYESTNVVSTIDEALVGTGKIQVGDQLAQIRWEPSESQIKELLKIFKAKAIPELTSDQPIGPGKSLTTLLDQLDNAPVDMNVRCYLKRDGKTIEHVVKLAYDSTWFDPQRGFDMAGFVTSLSQTHQVASLAEAFPLGAKETWGKFQEVLTVLRMLVTGKLSAKGLSGPIGIFEAAGAEANRGISALLLFLTFLSANLAIINFLPIPALDGGHMMFLTAEAIRGKPVNEALQVRLTLVGVMCLLCLMAFVIGKDILERLPF